MKYSFAPMEGITNRIFRRVHYAFFPQTDRYYTPFLAPTSTRSFSPRDLKELRAGREDGVPTTVQLLTRSSEDFLRAADILAEEGCDEVDLNLGCPSGTVFAKGKGSGLLRDADALARFLDELFARSPLPISIKTRIGVADSGEFAHLLEVYARYPIRELIIHTRTREEQYKGATHPECFALALERLRVPLTYNGDIFSVEDFRAVTERFPTASGVMFARGIVADPALIRSCRGGEKLTKEELALFLDALYRAYCEEFGAHNAMLRMKEVWANTRRILSGDERLCDRIARAKDPESYEYHAKRALDEMELMR